MTLTAAEVHAATFRTALRGYHTSDVDAFLDRVAAALARLHDENASLRGALAVEGLSSGAEGDRAPTAGAGDDATSGTQPRLLPGESGEEAALRTLLLAQRTADDVVAEARAEGQRVLADAHEEAEKRLAEARARVAELEEQLERRRVASLAELESERARLEGEVDQLRAFEREYRARLRAHLEGQLRELTVPGDTASAGGRAGA